jgi:hypothetical protein
MFRRLTSKNFDYRHEILLSRLRVVSHNQERYGGVRSSAPIFTHIVTFTASIL